MIGAPSSAAPKATYGVAMSPFFTVWAVITGTAAVGTLALSVATYVRMRRQSKPAETSVGGADNVLPS